MKNKNIVTLKVVPCLRDKTLAKACAESRSHLDMFANHNYSHTCGDEIVETFEIVEVARPKRKFITWEERKAMSPEDESKAEDFNKAYFINIDTGTRKNNKRVFYRKERIGMDERHFQLIPV